jgi:4-hydroxy-3-polyprenylbenzoate decarboxylase
MPAGGDLIVTADESKGRNSFMGPFEDFRSFLDVCEQMGEVRRIDGADRNLEIGALTEVTAELLAEPPMLLFDNIKGYPSGFRVVTLPLASAKRMAITLGLPPEKTKLELVRLAAQKIKEAQSIPPMEVDDGPILENVLTGAQADLHIFPTPLFHAKDGGHYIGTGDSLICRDPETGYINMGTYRMQIHEKNLLGLWMSPGQDGRLVCQKYWERGDSCPVAAVFGGDMLTFLASYTKIPWGVSELNFVGGLLGRPLAVIKGPVTGLPIPAHAEIAIEGEIPPPEAESRHEGPFGEWPGYYSGGSVGTGKPQPVIRVKAIYHRNHPVLNNSSPMWPGANNIEGISIRAGFLWDQLEKCGIQGIQGVYMHQPYLVAVAIRQLYAGHAKQAGMAALGCSAAARNGRYVVVVDEDIDPTNMKEILWAMETRVDPYRDILLVDGCWSTPLDPRMPPEKKASGDHTNSRAIFFAVRPYEWKDRFPEVSRAERSLREQMINKYKTVLSFPNV